MPDTPKGVPYPAPGADNNVPADLFALAQWNDDNPGIAALTTAARDALVGTQLWDGRVIRNTTTDRLQVYDTTTATWATLFQQADLDARYAGTVAAPFLPYNGSFAESEAGTTPGWDLVKLGGGTTDAYIAAANNAPHGRQLVLIAGGAGSSAMAASRRFQVKYGETFTLTADVARQGPPAQSFLRLAFYNSAGGYLGSVDAAAALVNTDANPNSYAKIGGVVSVNQGSAAYASVEIHNALSAAMTTLVVSNVRAIRHDGSRPGALIGIGDLNPDTAVGYGTSSTTALDVNSANLSVGFNVPPSGTVLVRLSAAAGAGNGPSFWGVRNWDQSKLVEARYAETADTRVRSVTMLVRDLLPHSDEILYWTHRTNGVTSNLYAGGAGSVLSGPATMEVYAV